MSSTFEQSQFSNLPTPQLDIPLPESLFSSAGVAPVSCPATGEVCHVASHLINIYSGPGQLDYDSLSDGDQRIVRRDEQVLRIKMAEFGAQVTLRGCSNVGNVTACPVRTAIDSSLPRRTILNVFRRIKN
jgi:hypothetical protein